MNRKCRYKKEIKFYKVIKEMFTRIMHITNKCREYTGCLILIVHPD